MVPSRTCPLGDVVIKSFSTGHQDKSVLEELQDCLGIDVQGRGLAAIDPDVTNSSTGIGQRGCGIYRTLHPINKVWVNGKIHDNDSNLVQLRLQVQCVCVCVTVRLLELLLTPTQLTTEHPNEKCCWILLANHWPAARHDGSSLWIIAQAACHHDVSCHHYRTTDWLDLSNVQCSLCKFWLIHPAVWRSWGTSRKTSRPSSFSETSFGSTSGRSRRLVHCEWLMLHCMSSIWHLTIWIWSALGTSCEALFFFAAPVTVAQEEANNQEFRKIRRMKLPCFH